MIEKLLGAGDESPGCRMISTYFPLIKHKLENYQTTVLRCFFRSIRAWFLNFLRPGGKIWLSAGIISLQSMMYRC